MNQWLQAVSPLFVGVALSNPEVIIHTLFGQRDSPALTIFGQGDTPYQRSGNIAFIQGEGILSLYTDQISALTWWFVSSSDIFVLLNITCRSMEP